MLPAAASLTCPWGPAPGWGRAGRAGQRGCRLTAGTASVGAGESRAGSGRPPRATPGAGPQLQAVGLQRGVRAGCGAHLPLAGIDLQDAAALELVQLHGAVEGALVGADGGAVAWGGRGGQSWGGSEPGRPRQAEQRPASGHSPRSSDFPTQNSSVSPMRSSAGRGASVRGGLPHALLPPRTGMSARTLNPHGRPASADAGSRGCRRYSPEQLGK